MPDYRYDVTFYGAEKIPGRDGRWRLLTNKRMFYTEPGSEIADNMNRAVARNLRDKTVRLHGTRDAITSMEVLG